MYINLTWNCGVCVGVAFLYLLCAFLLSFTTLKWIGQQHFAKTKRDGYISLPSNYNAIIAITIYYCVILQIAILHKAINTIQNKAFVFFCKKNKSLFHFKKPKKPEFEKNRRVGIFWKKRVFLNPCYLWILFCDFPLIARSGTTDATTRLIGRAPYT